MQLNKPNEGKLRMMQLNELRSEYCDKDVLEAIKRGENIDPRTFIFFYWLLIYLFDIYINFTL